MATPEDIFRTVTMTLAQVPWPMTTPDDFDALAKLVTKALIDEREACAQVADEGVFDGHALAQATEFGHGSHTAAVNIAAAIRNRLTLTQA